MLAHVLVRRVLGCVGGEKKEKQHRIIQADRMHTSLLSMRMGQACLHRGARRGGTTSVNVVDYKLEED